MSKETEKNKKEVIEFFKAAFCVDGEVKVIENEYFKIGVAIELNDSERGRFYIGHLIKKSNNKPNLNN